MIARSAAKILFVDMESPLAHMDVHNFFIRNVFPYFTNYHYMVEQDLYEKVLEHYRLSDNLPVSCFPAQSRNRCCKMAIRLNLFSKARHILDFIRINKINNLFFLSYDTLSLSFHANSFNDCNVFLMNHDNIARFVGTGLRRSIFKRLNKMIHVLYSCSDDSSMIFQLHQLFDLKRTLQIEHHIDDSRNIGIKTFDPNSVIIYAPSNGNDDRKILHFLYSIGNDGISVKAKVTEKTYRRVQNQYLEQLFFGFVDDNAFESGMNRADFILLLYPDNYRFRTSGLLFDAIAMEKPVITDNRYLFEAYLEKSGLGIFVENAFSVKEAVSRIDQAGYNILVENIRNYKHSYSAEKIGSDFAIRIKQIAES